MKFQIFPIKTYQKDILQFYDFAKIRHWIINANQSVIQSITPIFHSYFPLFLYLHSLALFFDPLRALVTAYIHVPILSLCLDGRLARIHRSRAINSFLSPEQDRAKYFTAVITGGAGCVPKKGGRGGTSESSSSSRDRNCARVRSAGRERIRVLSFYVS